MDDDLEHYFPKGTKVQVVPVYTKRSRSGRYLGKPTWEARTLGDGHPLKSAKREVTVRAWCLALGWEVVP